MQRIIIMSTSKRPSGYNRVSDIMDKHEIIQHKVHKPTAAVAAAAGLAGAVYGIHKYADNQVKRYQAKNNINFLNKNRSGLKFYKLIKDLQEYSEDLKKSIEKIEDLRTKNIAIDVSESADKLLKYIDNEIFNYTKFGDFVPGSERLYPMTQEELNEKFAKNII